MRFTRFIAAACGRTPRELTEFERAGFHYAHNLGEAPEDAFSFLGRFGAVDDIRAHQATTAPINLKITLRRRSNTARLIPLERAI